MDYYQTIKKIIQDRERAKLIECRDAEGTKALQAQGAARELAELIDEMEQMEHPPVKAGED